MAGRFQDAVERIVAHDNRYHRDAYDFLRQALDHTLEELCGEELQEHRHVTGRELVHGVVSYAQNEFGSMAVSVLDAWGMDEDADIGEMVFNLIEEGAFGRSDEDDISHFSNVLNLRDALLEPYRPSQLPPKPSTDSL